MLDDADFNIRPPAVSSDELAELVFQHYGVAGELTLLGGERDTNCVVRSDDGRAMLVKLVNEADTKEHVELQTEIMRHLEVVAPELNAPRVVTAKDGATYVHVTTRAGNKHFLRAMTLLTGQPLVAVRLDKVDLVDFGRFAAEIDRALASFIYPGGRPTHIWNIMNAPETRRQTECILDTRLRKAVEAAFDRFCDNALKRLKASPHQMIHCDLTGDNVMVDTTGTFAGIIDFGDAVFASRLVEVCVATAKIAEAFPAEPLQPICRFVGGYASHQSIDTEDADLILPGALARLAIKFTIQAWREHMSPDQTGLLSEEMGDARLAMDTMLAFDPQDFQKALKDAIKTGGHAKIPAPNVLPSIEEMLHRRNAVLGPHATITYRDNPIYISRAEGLWIYDNKGEPFLDSYNNVPHVGHGNRRVAEAISNQIRRLNTNTRYIYDTVIEYGERLTATLPEGLDCCMFVNSGSEATDIAWRIANVVTGNMGSLVLKDAYHGCTQATMNLSPMRWREGYDPGYVVEVMPPDTYRGKFGDGGKDPAGAYVQHVEEGVAELRKRGMHTACYLVDTSYCTNGILDVLPGYLPLAAEIVRNDGGLLIVDEVQYGFGRPGNAFWGFQMLDPDFVPDIVVMGKPIANGMPIGAVVTTREILDKFREKQNIFSTFGGNPVTTAAGLAVLDELEQRDLMRKADETGKYVMENLRRIKNENDRIGRISGRGLFYGVDFVKDPETKEPDEESAVYAQSRMRELGVLIGTEGRANNYLKIRPPMPFARHHAALMLKALEQALTELGPRAFRPVKTIK